MPEIIPLIAGNWKMFKTCAEAAETARNLAELTKGIKGCDIMIAPSSTSLYAVYQAIQGSNTALGAQNLHWEKEGAFTGENSADMIKSCGCSYVIIGHSERRHFFGETDETVNKRITCAIDNHIVTVFYIGETEKERDDEKTMNVLDKQVKDGFKDLIFPKKQGIYADKQDNMIDSGNRYRQTGNCRSSN